MQKVDQVVRQMPLWKLQTVGGSQFDFLYPNHGTGTSIELRPGVAFCLRQFHGLIGDLVRGGWIRYIRRHNHDALGTTADLSEFLFGSERSDLGVVREILDDLQLATAFIAMATCGSLAMSTTLSHGQNTRWTWGTTLSSPIRVQLGKGGPSSGGGFPGRLGRAEHATRE